MNVARRILITGAGGFVGTHLRVALAESADVVVPFVANCRTRSLHGVDLLDRAAVDAVLEEVKPDAVIHLAAQSSVARGAFEEGATWEVNLAGSLNLALAIARHVPAATVLFASSGEVYGASFLAGPATERTVANPLTTYAKSKRLAELVFDSVLPSSNQLIIARPFNHTGPGQREDFVLPSFVAQVARIERGIQAPYLRVGNLDVSRDFLDVRDVIDAYLALIEAAPRLPKRFTCNIASGEARPLRSILTTLQKLSNVSFEWVVDPARVRSVDVPVVQGDSTLLRSLTGWTPKTDVITMLQRLLDDRRRAA